jgi:predicted DNA-binding antitoxin AbrB/MazE fold protein
MTQKVQAVYEGGVLRPIEPLRLAENQLVSVILFDDATSEEVLEFEDPTYFEALADNTVTPEAVRAGLSKIPGSLDADFFAERDER